MPLFIIGIILLVIGGVQTQPLPLWFMLSAAAFGLMGFCKERHVAVKVISTIIIIFNGAVFYGVGGNGFLVPVILIACIVGTWKSKSTDPKEQVDGGIIYETKIVERVNHPIDCTPDVKNDSFADEQQAEQFGEAKESERKDTVWAILSLAAIISLVIVLSVAATNSYERGMRPEYIGTWEGSFINTYRSGALVGFIDYKGSGEYSTLRVNLDGSVSISGEFNLDKGYLERIDDYSGFSLFVNSTNKYIGTLKHERVTQGGTSDYLVLTYKLGEISPDGYDAIQIAFAKTESSVALQSFWAICFDMMRFLHGMIISVGLALWLIIVIGILSGIFIISFKRPDLMA